MRITVFTSNQPRHLALIRELATVADSVHAIMEVTTVFPGRRADFYKKSETMQAYFSRVMGAEKRIFGDVTFLPANAHPIVLRMGDLVDVPMDVLAPCLDSDVYVVFGSSYIKGELVEHLVAHEALNIHMGISPYYRGSSCNFWALYDGNPEMVGATIHMLSRGLDSGDMLFHALPSPRADAFDLGMQAVSAAHRGLIEFLRSGRRIAPQRQDRTQEIRYTRNADFTDAVAGAYLENMPTAEAIAEKLASRDDSRFLSPYVY